MHKNQKFFGNVNDSQQLIRRASEQLEMFLQDLSITDTVGLELLEVGSKNALFLAECKKVGIRACGTEIDPSRVARMRDEFPDLVIECNGSETLPFESEQFDYVVSFQVLEHMSHLHQMVREMVRVLKPGGFMYHVCPNYKSFYEGHYRVPWLPFLRKDSGMKYLRMLGRDPHYFCGFVFPVTPSRMRTMFDQMSHVQLLTLGEDQFKHRFTATQIRKVNNRFVRTVLNALYRLRLVTKPILHIVALWGLHYPLVVIARKNH